MLTDIKQIWSGGYSQKPLLGLRAGKLSLFYQNGNLRYVTDGRNEVIRMIYSALRDEHWLNIRPLITHERIERGTDWFKISYKCRYLTEKADFLADYFIEGRPDNTITFTLEGKALRSFIKNRFGFCILHPVKECSGKLCELTHSDGKKEMSSFPAMISPDQTFTDLKGMKWNTESCECHLEFTGDIFETEDQRNWTDASFKTYCTPLSMPFPAEIKSGHTISQKVLLKVSETSPVTAPEQEDEVRITFNPEDSADMPETGTCRSTRPWKLTSEEYKSLRLIGLDHYRCDLNIFGRQWKSTAEEAFTEAVMLSCSLELSVFFDDNWKDQISELIQWVRDRKPDISVINLFHKTAKVTPAELVSHAVPLIRKEIPSVRTGCGTNANFAELNRSRPGNNMTDLITYSIHPQEHASDNLTLTENLESQRHTADTALSFSSGKGIWVSPVTLQRRFNANIENYETAYHGTKVPPQVDNRIMSLFGACWTAGSLKYLAEAGVRGMTFYEAAGERGLLQGSYDSRWPDDFKPKAGMIFSVYHVLKWFLNNKSFRIIKSHSTSPLKTDVLALINNRNIKFALINYGNNFQKVNIILDAESVHSFSLDTESFASASANPEWLDSMKGSEVKDLTAVTLSPYSITFMEGLLTG